jgi:RHS repeat-associated protein
MIGTTGGTNPDSGDIYLGLDRFGRVIDANWANVAGTTTLARVKYGYNRVSSRTWRDNLSPGMTGYDELYGYDQLQRLQTLGRGTLNGTQTAITSPTFGQTWTLDETGNWNGFKQSDNGTTWPLDQARTANTVNEITSLVNETSKAWTTPGYDKAGNMTRIPVPGTLPDGVAWNTMSLSDWDNLKLADWEEMTLDNVEGVYDAWNRLVRLHVGDTTLAEYAYDARGYRIRKDSYTDGTLNEARHYYYTPGWQVVEERVGTSNSADRQFVWGLRYIDDLVLRDRDTDGNGTLDERRYCLQDGNWNTIALTSTSGIVTERFSCDAYGVPTFLTSTGTVQAFSATGWETLYTGYRWDGDPSRMYYVRNRFLLPFIGTWNKRDPIGYIAGTNLQGYVNDMPLQAVDAFGLQPWDSRGSYLGSGYFEQRVNGILEGFTQLLFGGRFKAPSDGELYGRSYETPTGGVGGVAGGVARDLTLRTLPIERNPSDFSLMGLDAASDLGVSGPFGAANHLCYGTSNSGREPRSRTLAAVELVGVGIGVGRGLRCRLAPSSATNRTAQFNEYMHFRGQGFTPAQSKYLTQPYGNRAGHHFPIPQRTGRDWNIPRTIIDSRFNVLRPNDINIGRFYELHYRVDPFFHGTRFPGEIGGTWRGSQLGLDRYSGLQKLWYSTPGPTKVGAGIGVGTSAAGAGYWWLSDDSESR